VGKLIFTVAMFGILLPDSAPVALHPVTREKIITYKNNFMGILLICFRIKYIGPVGLAHRVTPMHNNNLPN
tara:strand:- start:1009 stop:1221 length:213 start_codon:yes stop_codon:yes gene_type:complete